MDGADIAQADCAAELLVRTLAQPNRKLADRSNVCGHRVDWRVRTYNSRACVGACRYPRGRGNIGSTGWEHSAWETCKFSHAVWYCDESAYSIANRPVDIAWSASDSARSVPSWRRPAHVRGRRKQRTATMHDDELAELAGPWGVAGYSRTGSRSYGLRVEPSRAELTCATMSPCCSASASRACHSLSPATQSIVSTYRAGPRKQLRKKQSVAVTHRHVCRMLCAAVCLLHGSAAICLRTPIT